ncbi:MAG: 30S ribosomal protein S3 [bacterium]
MGQKVHPIGFRLGINKTWNSIWFAKRNYAELLHEDLAIRDYIKRKLYRSGISKIEIKRISARPTVIIHTSRPGIIIGRRGAEVERLQMELQRMTNKQVVVDIQEVKVAELEAQLVAESVVSQIEKRMGFRRAMKQAANMVMKAGAKGVKVACSGRLDGAEIARSEWTRQGRVPLHTLRADIDYGFAEAYTTYGRVGVKVWVFKGEILPTAKEEKKEIPVRAPRERRRRRRQRDVDAQKDEVSQTTKGQDEG